MTKQDKASKIATLLMEAYPDARTELNYTKPHELLFAVMLSAQTTDALVNKVTPELFKTYPTVGDFAKADLGDLKAHIRSVNFYNNKAKNIQLAAKQIVEKHGGKVPDTMEELDALPGVARKTANVILGQLFGKNEGFTVDTHVLRLSKWFGLSKNTDPVKVEQDLMAIFPQNTWSDISTRLVLLGRYVLTAKNPKYQGTVWEPLLTIS